MNNLNLQKLKDKASEMALRNIWGEKSYKINMAILKMDNTNLAACTRLAKFYMINDNVPEAKNMYLKALEIDPNSQGAINNLLEIEKEQQECNMVDQIKTAGELFRTGQSSMIKGKLNLAIKLFTKAYSIEPLLKYAVSLAFAYKKMGKHDLIENLYKQLIEANQTDSDVEAINNEFTTLRFKIKSLAE